MALFFFPAHNTIAKLKFMTKQFTSDDVKWN